MCFLCAVANTLREFFTGASKVPDVCKDLSDLRSRGADMGVVFNCVFIEALEQRGVDFGKRMEPVLQLYKAALEEGAATPAEIEAGAVRIVKDLHNLLDDQPKVRYRTPG